MGQAARTVQVPPAPRIPCSIRLTAPRARRIAATTAPGVPKEPCIRPPKEREAHRGADFREVLADFKQREATQRQLNRAFLIEKPYFLLTPEEVRKFEAALSGNDPSIDERFQGVRTFVGWYWHLDQTITRRIDGALGHYSTLGCMRTIRGDWHAAVVKFRAALQRAHSAMCLRCFSGLRESTPVQPVHAKLMKPFLRSSLYLA